MMKSARCQAESMLTADFTLIRIDRRLFLCQKLTNRRWARFNDGETGVSNQASRTESSRISLDCCAVLRKVPDKIGQSAE
jgi:hypothetical protein